MTASLLTVPLTTDHAPPAATDAELVAACLVRDPAAERALYDRHIDNLYEVAFRLTGDPDLASDVTQDAFERAFAHLNQYRGPATLRAWLTAIAIRSARMAMRAIRAREAGRERLSREMPNALAPNESVELAAHLSSAVGALSQKLRVVFVMHDVEGFSHAEIADVLGIPEATSKTRLTKAKAVLRVTLAAHWRDRRP